MLLFLSVIPSLFLVHSRAMSFTSLVVNLNHFLVIA